MTGRPLEVVITPLTTLFTVVAEVDRPTNDFDNTVRRGPLGVITGNETNSTKKKKNVLLSSLSKYYYSFVE